jgi:hypothetical protein
VRPTNYMGKLLQVRQDEESIPWKIVMSKEQKSNREAKKPKAQSKKQKKEAKNSGGLGIKPA